MAPVVVSARTLPIAREDDVVLVRRVAREVAQARGFDAFALAAVTTATSEIARNAWVHGRGGEATIEEVELAGRAGVRVTCRDQGPGIEDLARALHGGYSAAGSLGLGLSGARRLVDDFNVETAPGRGTLVVLTKWTRA